jgi:hypothetical protein
MVDLYSVRFMSEGLAGIKPAGPDIAPEVQQQLS